MKSYAIPETDVMTPTMGPVAEVGDVEEKNIFPRLKHARASELRCRAVRLGQGKLGCDELGSIPQEVN